MALSGERESISLPHRVRSVDRAIALLKAVGAAGGAHSLTALARQCDLDRATAWRLLLTLEAQGMVTRDPRDGWFAVGPAVAELAAGTSRSLVETAQPVLERISLETGEIACLGVVDGDELHYVAEVIPAIVQDQSWLREPVVLHASSMGKAFLAYLDDDRVAALVGERPARFTDTTITEPKPFRQELRRIRAQGYAVCRGELEDGSWGVAAAVLGVREEPVAVVCLWGPDRRGDHTRLEALGRLARRTARELRAG
ncbi:MAG TPA: IclR family transcriptional regulator [Nocardioides sp.]|jgi:DNA-binding IclR family transcriptional regulator|uniref:IclR family transcriptional regulator n=1 Tax=Nocardioides sp. TaxID=35761 RepID=UPI002E34D664|nr:IclR family transcriptional regulator [Nocardioides sp.]HEX3932821.1 IclR family transcriptional regulator [Nocardioides sp.]